MVADLLLAAKLQLHFSGACSAVLNTIGTRRCSVCFTHVGGLLLVRHTCTPVEQAFTTWWFAQTLNARTQQSVTGQVTVMPVHTVLHVQRCCRSIGDGVRTAPARRVVTGPRGARGSPCVCRAHRADRTLQKLFMEVRHVRLDVQPMCQGGRGSQTDVGIRYSRLQRTQVCWLNR